VAREAVTLDHLSRGRLTLGVGLGIDFWREFRAFAEPATGDAERAELLDDGIEIIDRLWSGEPVTFAGRRSSVEGVRFLPRPVQRPRIPIWSAVLWPPRPNPVRRAAGVDGVVPFRPDGPLHPDHVRELHASIAARRSDLGLDLAPYDICLHGPRELAPAFEEAGVTWFMEACYPEQPLAEVRRIIEAGPPRTAGPT
jgi:alkanesulfonate monooxygenase SsuD/methylene tetrahydromethanopterin reductase-like flavin-dependent oxidoreductase (luciferase family)